MTATTSRWSALIFLARWASDEAVDQVEREAFAPTSYITNLLLRALPLNALPSPLLRLFCGLLMPHMSARELTDGNVNYSFCCSGRRGRQVFLKQAQGHLKWQPQMALERERMARELRYFDEAGSALREQSTIFLPRILHFDANSTVVVQDFLVGYGLLFDHCFDKGAAPRSAFVGLGSFLGLVHARTLAPAAAETSHTAAAQAFHFWNPSLRAIQLEHVFTVCFERSALGQLTFHHT